MGPDAMEAAMATQSQANVRSGIFSQFPATDWEAASVFLTRNWWLVVLRGVLAILFGAIALFAPVAAMLSLALVFAIYLVVDGIVGIAASVRAARREERWMLLLAQGVLNIVVGVLVFLFPVGAVLAFVFVTAFWAVLSGALMVAAAYKLAATHGRWWLALGGIVSIVFGILLAASPVIGAVVLTWWIGAYAVVFGVLLIAFGIHLRSRKPSETVPAST